MTRYETRYSLGAGGALVAVFADKTKAIDYANTNGLCVYQTIGTKRNGRFNQISSKRIF